jgi:hypothetical protein
MRACIELRSNNASKTFIELSFGACNIVEFGSPPPYFVNPKIDLCSRERILPIMIPETGNNLDPSHVFVREEFDDVALFNFQIVDTFSHNQMKNATIVPP